MCRSRRGTFRVAPGSDELRKRVRPWSASRMSIYCVGWGGAVGFAMQPAGTAMLQLELWGGAQAGRVGCGLALGMRMAHVAGGEGLARW